MLRPTMLDDVGPTCWLRLNRPLQVQLGFAGQCRTIHEVYWLVWAQGALLWRPRLQ